MITALSILGLIAASSGAAALIFFTVQKVTGRNFYLIIKIFTRTVLFSLFGMIIVFVWYILGAR